MRGPRDAGDRARLEAPGPVISGLASPHWQGILQATAGKGKSGTGSSKPDPIKRGSRHGILPGFERPPTSSKPDPIKRGSRRCRSGSRADRWFKTRPDQKGIKTAHDWLLDGGTGVQNQTRSKGDQDAANDAKVRHGGSKPDPIKRGSRRPGRIPWLGRQGFKTRPDQKGIKTRSACPRSRACPTGSKPDPIKRGSRLGRAAAMPQRHRFKTRPDQKGIKTLRAEQGEDLGFKTRPDQKGIKTPCGSWS